MSEHVMTLKDRDANGLEFWQCPTCGRSFWLHWPPEYQKVIIEPGDETVIHNGERQADPFERWAAVNAERLEALG